MFFFPAIHTRSSACGAVRVVQRSTSTRVQHQGQHWQRGCKRANTQQHITISPNPPSLTHWLAKHCLMKLHGSSPPPSAFPPTHPARIIIMLFLWYTLLTIDRSLTLYHQSELRLRFYTAVTLHPCVDVAATQASQYILYSPAYLPYIWKTETCFH